MAVYKAVLDRADLEKLLEGGTVGKIMSGGPEGVCVFEIQISDQVLKMIKGEPSEKEKG